MKKTMANIESATFAQLVAARAFFHMEKAYLPVQGTHRQLIREFKRMGQTWRFVGEGIANRNNYGHILPADLLVEE